jgi:hypothetical protein
VVTGERSSWLTSEANRASLATRACRSPAVSLNAAAIGPRSLSSRSGSRVDRSPCAIRAAAEVSSVSGRSTRRLAHQPIEPPSSPLASTPPSSIRLMNRKIRSRSRSGNTSTYETWDSGSFVATATSGAPPTRNRCRAMSPRSAAAISAGGMSATSMLSVAVPPAIQPSGCRTKIAASGEEARPVSSAPRSEDPLASLVSTSRALTSACRLTLCSRCWSI